MSTGLSTVDQEAIPSKDRKKKGLSKSRSTVGGDDQIEYKAGWVVRKCLYDSDGKRSNCYKFDSDFTLYIASPFWNCTTSFHCCICQLNFTLIVLFMSYKCDVRRY